MAREANDFQKFLDENQYTMNGVLRYERIFGRTFVSTGGKETTDYFLKQLKLKEGDYVLDVGCGIGGSAFRMDLDYGARVRGIDLSRNMVVLAQERRKEVGSTNTSFHIEDVTTADYKNGEFDVIYSRDTILHIEDKASLFRNCFKWLKPGGRLLVTDYSCRGENHSAEFVEYVKQRGYWLLSPDQYRTVVQAAGFTDVIVTDLRDMFLDILTRERERTMVIKKDFIREFSQKDYDDIVNGWESKIRRVTEGSQKWISIYARKAL